MDKVISRPARILFLNTGAKHNLGDRAMLLNVLHRVREHLPTAELFVDAGVPDWMVRELQLSPVSTLANCWARGGGRAKGPYAFASTLAMRVLLGTGAYRLLPTGSMEYELLSAIDGADLIWLVGGGYLNDLGATEARAVLTTAYLGQSQGRKVVMTGQGLGPFTTRLSRWLFKAVAGKAESIMLREAVFGASEITRLGSTRIQWRAGVDDACSLPARHDQNIQPATLALHFRHSSFHEGSGQLEGKFSHLVCKVVARGQRVKLFVFNERKRTELDEYEVWKSRSGHAEAVDVVQYSDPRQILAELQACQCAIGMAYHFHLFALLSGVPSLALYSGEYYESKFQGIDALFDQPKSFICYDDANEELLEKFVVMENRCAQPERADRLARRATILRAMATEQICETLGAISHVPGGLGSTIGAHVVDSSIDG